ncbi:unnamed protein product [Amoebophrya sp. A120]|nr:unnamed protein product [Amoebophrya sp. A120]|eukprot:GSA120T00013764001.1
MMQCHKTCCSSSTSSSTCSTTTLLQVPERSFRTPYQHRDVHLVQHIFTNQQKSCCTPDHGRGSKTCRMTIVQNKLRGNYPMPALRQKKMLSQAQQVDGGVAQRKNYPLLTANSAALLSKPLLDVDQAGASPETRPLFSSTSDDARAATDSTRSRIFIRGICCASEVPMCERILYAMPSVTSVNISVPLREATIEHNEYLAPAKTLVDALNEAKLDASLLRKKRGSNKRNKSNVQLTEEEKEQERDHDEFLGIISTTTSTNTSQSQKSSVLTSSSAAEATRILSLLFWGAKHGPMKLYLAMAAWGVLVVVKAGLVPLLVADEGTSGTNTSTTPTLLFFIQYFFPLLALLYAASDVYKRAIASFPTSLGMYSLLSICSLGSIPLNQGEDGLLLIFLFLLAENLQARVAKATMEVLDESLSSSLGLNSSSNADDSSNTPKYFVNQEIQLRKGMAIPCDGVLITEGVKIFVDESLLTGEMRPVVKELNSTEKKSSKLIGGTIVVSIGEKMNKTTTSSSRASATGATTGGTKDSITSKTDKRSTSSSNKGVYMRITSPKSASQSERILQLARQSLSEKNNSPAMEKFLNFYTPFVFLLAVVITGLKLLYSGLNINTTTNNINLVPQLGTFFLTFLVGACPCALILAGPLAFVCGTVAASRREILIKDPYSCFDRLAGISKIFYDKTGTLTQGRFQICDFQLVWTQNTKPGFQSKHAYSLKDVLQLIYLIESEQTSVHPLALALTQFCKRRLALLEEGDDGKDATGYGLNHNQIIGKNKQFMLSEDDNIEVLRGRGVQAEVDISMSGTGIDAFTANVMIGNYTLARERNWLLPSNNTSSSTMMNNNMNQQQISNSSSTSAHNYLGKLFVAVDDVVIAEFSALDPLREEAGTALKFLGKEFKINGTMLTGDQKEIAGQIAQQLVNKIQQPFTVLPQLSPEDKMKAIALVQTQPNVGGGVVAAGGSSNAGHYVSLPDHDRHRHDSSTTTIASKLEFLRKFLKTAIFVFGGKNNSALYASHSLWTMNSGSGTTSASGSSSSTNKRLVAMVGDGINDSLALTKADVSFSMAASGTALAVQSSDIALFDSDLRSIPFSVLLARKTVQKFRQNLLLAIVGKLALVLILLFNTMVSEATTTNFSVFTLAICLDFLTLFAVLMNSVSLLGFEGPVELQKSNIAGVDFCAAEEEKKSAIEV